MFVLLACLSNPFSLSTVHIQSADPRTPPVIDPNYYSHPNDITIMSHALLRGYSLGITQPPSSYLKNGGHQFPTETLTPEAFAAKARAQTTTMFHPRGDLCDDAEE
jgi:choline dehydrogenase-like flavoprotein